MRYYMELQKNVIPSRIQKYGSEDNIIIVAGKRLKIETTPGGNEILDVTVPDGKQWIAAISVDIIERSV
jgi:hypothetical protein